ncbi:peptidylprolyl isomerase [Burkholderiaceae bacterium DAT-1]|nr:peptidylprolyl isomerase [Burkholderiaceae bacterium DAT-1]
MFDFVNNNRRLANVALGLVSIGLVVGGGFAGLELLGADDYVAKVGKSKITQRDLYEIARGQDIPENMKPQVIETLIRRQLIRNESSDVNLVPGVRQLQDAILNIPEFQKDGKFDPETYRSLLAANGMTVDSFQAKLQDDIRERALLGMVNDSGIVAKASADRLQGVFMTPRMVSQYNVMPEKFLERVTVADADVKKYYDTHLVDYKVEERVKVQYLVLSPDTVGALAQMDEAALRKYFDEHKASLAQEQRKVRHILISADKGASAADRAKAKEKATALLADLQKDPKRFSELAKANSQDPGSAEQGGDLGLVAHDGTMVKPFEDAAFKLAKGEVSGLVETQFGYHIITVDEIKTRGFDDARSEIETQFRKQFVSQQMAAMAQKLQDLTYQHPDSLDAAAKELKLTVQNSDWMTRTTATEPVLNDPKVRETVFGDDVLKAKHNSEPIELKDSVQIVARVLAHEPGRTRALDEVKASISAKLRQNAAEAMAAAEGKRLLAALQKGEKVDVAWEAGKAVSRMKPQGLDDEGINTVFGVSSSKLPGYSGLVSGGRYLLFKVEAAPAEPVDPMMAKNFAGAVVRAQSDAVQGAYLETLRLKHEVKVKASGK